MWFKRWIAPARLLMIAGVLLVSPVCAPAQKQPRPPRHPRKYTPPPDTARLAVKVVKAWNGKPLLNAAVIFRQQKDGKEQGSLELKTNEEGKVDLDLIPIGSKVRLQVIANGYQTYGGDYDVDSAEKTIVVKMNKPTQLYSIYKDAGAAAGTADKPGAADDKQKQTAPGEAAPGMPDPKQIPPDHAAPPPQEKVPPPAPQA